MEALTGAQHIDGSSLLADILFWSGLGFSITFVKSKANRESLIRLTERIKQI